jgi:predicted naringenin-chalcone synthase
LQSASRALKWAMFITGIGTAVPPRRYTQKECWEAVQKWDLMARLAPRSQAILRKVLLGNNGIVTRHLALDSIEESFVLTPDALHGRFCRHAPILAAQAGERALRQATVSALEIDAVIVSTCTGYLCPGLTSYVAERLGLRPDVLALDLVGLGCGAALPNLRTSEALLASGRAKQVLSICVEICSAAAYIDDDPGVLISACLFGDGAGASVLSVDPQANGRRVEWKAAGSILDPTARDLLRFEQRGGLLRNILTTTVAGLAASHAETVFREVAQKADVKRKEIAAWILHAGGREVLAALRQQFDLEDEDLKWSSAVLQELGNISSAFVYHVLDRALRGGARGGWWWMSSFGAGFSCHGALLEVE